MKKVGESVCPVCGGSKVPGKTTFTVDLGFGLFVARDVPALVCSQCGEEWIDDSVARQLEEHVKEAREREHQFEVVKF